jgi:hypothetical protein
MDLEACTPAWSDLLTRCYAASVRLRPADRPLPIARFEGWRAFEDDEPAAWFVRLCNTVTRQWLQRWKLTDVPWLESWASMIVQRVIGDYLWPIPAVQCWTVSHLGLPDPDPQAFLTAYDPDGLLSTWGSDEPPRRVFESERDYRARMKRAGQRRQAIIADALGTPPTKRKLRLQAYWTARVHVNGESLDSIRARSGEARPRVDDRMRVVRAIASFAALIELPVALPKTPSK